ncbi:MAG: AtpZ/AtpI family protein [Frankiaceae bacterium]|nr:AtpZ/AtpI family protein [Frankiaceae bacterium]MBV9871994.1 AtpZ/AtpI family protein [Frankiaceae bacterium]
MSEPGKQQSMNLTTLLGVGAMFGICVGIGVFLGVLADNAAGTSPLLALLGTLVGILGGAGGAFQVIRPYTRSSTAAPRPAEPDDDVRSDR